MKYVLAALILLTQPAHAEPKPAVNDYTIHKTITRDLGGVISNYEAKYFGPEGVDTTWIIDGFCDSACTMVLGTKSHCATPRAMLGFHAGYTEIMFYWKTPYLALSYQMFKHYPEAVQRWVAYTGAMQRIMPMTFMAGEQGPHLDPSYGIVKGKVADFVPACPQ